MSLLLALALAAVGWFLLDSGMEFFGALFIIGGILALFLNQPGSRRPAPQQRQAGYPAQQPVIIRSGRAPPLQNIKLRIKDTWTGTTNYEDFFENMSGVLLLPVKVLWRLVRIGKRK